MAPSDERRPRVEERIHLDSLAGTKLASPAATAIATLNGRPLQANRGIPLNLEWIEDVRVNTSAVERRAASHVARRTVKKDWQAAWLLRAITCMDLTTLSGDDTDERVRRLCSKARHPIQQDLVEKLGIEKLGIKVAAVCVYHTFVETALEALEGSGIKIPAKRVHDDYTAWSAPQRVRDLMGAEAEELLEHRFAIINLWRPIRGPVLESPLVLCDAQSLSDENLIASDLKYPDRTGETYSITYNPGQRYYYFPKMQPDEPVLIRCFDSAPEGAARFSAHTGFDDPTSPPDAPPRESLEVRTLVFFPPGA